MKYNPKKIVPLKSSGQAEVKSINSGPEPPPFAPHPFAQWLKEQDALVLQVLGFNPNHFEHFSLSE